MHATKTARGNLHINHIKQFKNYAKPVATSQLSCWNSIHFHTAFFHVHESSSASVHNNYTNVKHYFGFCLQNFLQTAGPPPEPDSHCAVASAFFTLWSVKASTDKSCKLLSNFITTRLTRTARIFIVQKESFMSN